MPTTDSVVDPRGQHVYPEAGCPYSRSTTRSGLPPHLLCTCPRSDGLRPSDFLLDGHVGCSSLQAKYCPFSTGWMARRYSITLSSIVPSRAPIIATVGSSVIIHQLVSIARKIISCRSEVCGNVYRQEKKWDVVTINEAASHDTHRESPMSWARLKV